MGTGYIDLVHTTIARVKGWQSPREAEEGSRTVIARLREIEHHVTRVNPELRSPRHRRAACHQVYTGCR